MQPTHNILSEAIRAQSFESLSRHLTAMIDRHSHLWQARSNVMEASSTALRDLFEKSVKQAESFSDIVAERIRALGGTAYATIRLVAARWFLPECSVGVADEQANVSAGPFTDVGLCIDTYFLRAESHLSGTSLFNGIEPKRGVVAEGTAA